MPPLPDTRPRLNRQPIHWHSSPRVEPRSLPICWPAPRGWRNQSASPFARFVEAVKKPIHAARLRRQVSGLQQALDAAWEKLGMLAIGHRPFHPHLRTELPELSALQQQVGAKQSMADSLRQIKGSNAVLREVETELAELRDRQRRLMTAIGQKAEASTPDIPDGPAHYAAVKRVRSSLESAERELLGMDGVPRAPGAGEAGHKRLELFCSRSKTPLFAAGAVVAIILVLCAVGGSLAPACPPFSTAASLLPATGACAARSYESPAELLHRHGRDGRGGAEWEWEWGAGMGGMGGFMSMFANVVCWISWAESERAFR